MITPAFAATMARYNGWQNQSHMHACDTLTDAERTRDRGAHFGSIQATLNHLLWGDQIWMHRFAGTPKPAPGSITDSVRYFSDWAAFKAERLRFDAVIVDWADALEPAWLDGELSWYSGAIGANVTKPRALLVMHFFNHQTHHRGQVHAMLTAAGAKPNDTDLAFMPD